MVFDFCYKEPIQCPRQKIGSKGVIPSQSARNIDLVLV